MLLNYWAWIIIGRYTIKLCKRKYYASSLLPKNIALSTYKLTLSEGMYEKRFLTATTLIYTTGTEITVAAGINFASVNIAYYEPGVNNLEHLRLENTKNWMYPDFQFDSVSNINLRKILHTILDLKKKNVKHNLDIT